MVWLTDNNDEDIDSPIHGDADEDVRRQVEAEGSQHQQQLAHQVAY